MGFRLGRALERDSFHGRKSFVTHRLKTSLRAIPAAGPGGGARFYQTRLQRTMTRRYSVGHSTRMKILPKILARDWLSVLAMAALGLQGVSVSRAANPHPDFEVQVTGQGAPVIFIPGLATPGAIWQPAVEQLHGAFQCHVISLAGFGGVKPTGTNPFLPKVRDELIDYIRSEKLDHPLIVGHSLGGFMALWIAETAPELPGRLLVVDALPFLPAILNPDATPQTIRVQVAPLIAQMSDATPDQFADIESQSIAAMVTSPAEIEKVVALTKQSDPKTTALSLMELMTTDIRPNLGKITCPVLVLAALADKTQYAPRETILANYRKQFDGLRGVRIEGVDDAKHFIMVDDMSAFMKALQGELTPVAAK